MSSNSEGMRFPPLPTEMQGLRDLYDRNNSMLELWRNQKDIYMPGYVMLGRWGQCPDNPRLQDWMARLAYAPIGDAQDERLPDPRDLFPVSAEVKPYLPPNDLWRRMERLRHIRHDAIHLNFDPKRLALDAQAAVLYLISIAEALCDHLLDAMAVAPIATAGAQSTSEPTGGDASAASGVETADAAKRPFRGPGQAEPLILGALIALHKYSDGGVSENGPFSIQTIADQANVATGSVTTFFKKKFGGRDSEGTKKDYDAACRRGQIAFHLSLLNGDLPAKDVLQGIGDARAQRENR